MNNQKPGEEDEKFLADIESGNPDAVSDSFDYFHDNNLREQDVARVELAFWNSSDTAIRKDIIRIMTCAGLYASIHALIRIYITIKDPALSFAAGAAIVEMAREQPDSWDYLRNIVPGPIMDDIVYNGM
jgi:hypothetical protein